MKQVEVNVITVFIHLNSILKITTFSLTLSITIYRNIYYFTHCIAMIHIVSLNNIIRIIGTHCVSSNKTEIQTGQEVRPTSKPDSCLQPLNLCAFWTRIS